MFGNVSRYFLSPLLSVTTLLLLEYSGILSSWKYTAEDFLFAAFTKKIDPEIILVEIDAASIRTQGRWPWSRHTHASMIDFLQAAGAKQIFFDIDFSQSSGDPAADEDLARAINAAESTRIVLPSFWQTLSLGAKNTYVLTEPLPMLEALSGIVNVSIASDGLVRDIVHLDSSPRGTRPSATAVLAQAEDLTADIAYPIDFAISPTQLPRVSYQDILSGGIPTERFAEKTVFVGSTALELGDFLPVPVHGFVPGVVLQALSYQTLKYGQIRAAPTWSSWLAAVIVLALWSTVRHFSWKRYLGVVIVAAVLCFTLTALFYLQWHLMLSLVPGFTLAVLLGFFEQLQRFDRQALELLRERLRRNRQAALIQVLFGANTDSIIVVDEHGKVRSANHKAKELLQISGNAEGKALKEILPLEEDLDEVARQSTKGKRPELNIDAPSGKLTLEVSVTRSVVADGSFFTLIARDITRSKHLRDELEYRANHDVLTGLLNRSALNDVLANIHSEKRSALLLMDLDRFKQLNDSLGHSEGDNVLVTLAHRFNKLIHGKKLLIVRLGGDEFALYVDQFKDINELKDLGFSLIRCVTTPFHVAGMSIDLDASIGIAIYPDHAKDGPSLLRQADIAMYAAKSARTQIEVYDESKNHDGLRSMRIATALRRAIQNNTLELYYQPKTYLTSGNLCGAEALLRWSDNELGFISPSEFVPLAENTGLIEPLTLWTVNQALQDIADWRERGYDIHVAINLSARHLSDSDFQDQLTKILTSANLPLGTLELEITETELMADLESGKAFSSRMHSLGISMAIDDYGTGFSSLSYLKGLNLQTLKIDRYFIDGIDKDLDNRHIVSATITMAHNLGMKVVAEGIETPEEQQVLSALDCDIAQGYLISKPTPKDEFINFVDFLENKKPSIKGIS